MLLFSLSTKLHYDYVTFPDSPDYVLLTIVQNKESTHTLATTPVFTDLLRSNKCIHMYISIQ